MGIFNSKKLKTVKVIETRTSEKQQVPTVNLTTGSHVSDTDGTMRANKN